MQVKPILWTYVPRADGSCNIKLYVNANGEKKYIKTKFHVLPSEFDNKKGLVKKTHPNHVRINAKIGEQKRIIETQLIESGDINLIGKTKQTSFIDFLNSYYNDIQNGFTDHKPNTAKSYKSLITRINQFKDEKKLKDISFNDIDLEFYDNFRNFLLGGVGCGLPGFGKHIKVIKTVMRIAEDKELHSNEIYKHHRFKVHQSKPSNKIYLNEDEIEAIKNVNLESDVWLEKERDRFLVSYYFLMRFEDSRNIKRESFFEKSGQRYLKYKQQKTGHECIVPVKSEAWEILEKRGFDMDFGSNAQSNRNIKTVCALAKVDAQVKQGEESGPKWKFVTTHTARRSAATNLAMQNMNIKIIADLGGWTDIRTLRSYLRASGLDSAAVAKDFDFFL